MTVATTDEARAAEQAAQQNLPVELGRLSGLDQAWRMSKALAQSGLMPQALRNKPSDVLVTILYGQEIGLTPMQALQSIYVVNGRPTMSGQLWLAKVRQAGHKVSLTATDKEATCTITRHDDPDNPHTEKFTWAEAEKAKLTGKDVWKSYPKRMLGWRAVSNCATITCPEVALGFELYEGIPDTEPARPSLAQVAEQRVDTNSGEVHDAEVVDDDAVRAQVAAIADEHGPTQADIDAMNEEAAREQAERDAAPSGLFGGDE